MRDYEFVFIVQHSKDSKVCRYSKTYSTLEDARGQKRIDYKQAKNAGTYRYGYEIIGHFSSLTDVSTLIECDLNQFCV